MGNLTDQNQEHTEAILTTAALILSRRKQKQELDLLAKADAKIDWTGNNNGVDYGVLYLEIPFELFEQLGEYREVYSSNIQDVINYIIKSKDENIYEVRFTPALAIIPNWRETIHTLADSQLGLPLPDSQYQADVFMLMPFSEPKEVDEVYRDHVIPVVKGLGLTIKRADDFFSTEAIVKDIWSAITAAKIVIADCSGRNTNVFYELGLAHATRRNTIMLTMNENDIPFDLRQWRYIKYGITSRGMNQLETDLENAIRKLLPELESKKQIQDTDDFDQIPF